MKKTEDYAIFDCVKDKVKIQFRGEVYKFTLHGTRLAEPWFYIQDKETNITNMMFGLSWIDEDQAVVNVRVREPYSKTFYINEPIVSVIPVEFIGKTDDDFIEFYE